MIESDLNWWNILLGDMSNTSGITSFVGAGGKTTLMFLLAETLAKQGLATAVSTTTKIYQPKLHQHLLLVTDGKLNSVKKSLCKEKILVTGLPWDGGKLTAPPSDILSYLSKHSDALLLESDGSHRLPIKFPRTGEPVLWQGGGNIIVVCGLSCIGRTITESCHRASLAQAVLGVAPMHILTPQDIVRLLIYGYGKYREHTFVLNQADTESARQHGSEIANDLLEHGARYVVVTSLHRQYARIYERVH